MDASTTNRPTSFSNGTSESKFAAFFALSGESLVQITAALSVHRNDNNFFDTANCSASFLLTGTTNTFPLSVNTDLPVLDAAAQFNQTVLLPAGIYSITATSSAEAKSKVVAADFNGMATSSYSVSVSIVPEPSTIALALVGLVVILRTFSRASRHGELP